MEARKMTNWLLAGILAALAAIVFKPEIISTAHANSKGLEVGAVKLYGCVRNKSYDERYFKYDEKCAWKPVQIDENGYVMTR